MPNVSIDLRGRSIGRWRVLEKGPIQSGQRYWLCRCACGSERLVAGHNLRKASTHSCGCRIREITSARRKGQPAYTLKGGSYAAESVVFARYRYHARVRGIPFELVREDAAPLFRGRCFYCGAPAAQVQPGCAEGMRSGRTTPFIYNGIDRLDNEKGYIKGNVVSCCGYCNRAKLETPAADFIAWIRRAYEHLRTTPP